jgi:HD domain
LTTPPANGATAPSRHARHSPYALDPALAELGIPIPDTALARDARDLIAEVAEPFLVNHSVRSYAWAVGLANVDQRAFDVEILYVAAVLHDIGLVPAYDAGGCFEVDGAIAAREFVLAHGCPPDRATRIHDVIVRHMTAEQPPDAWPEDILLDQSTGTDVTGYRLSEMPPAWVAPVLAAYPRLGFKREFAARFEDQAARKPHCRVGEMVRTGKLEAIANAPFDS